MIVIETLDVEIQNNKFVVNDKTVAGIFVLNADAATRAMHKSPKHRETSIYGELYICDDTTDAMYLFVPEEDFSSTPIVSAIIRQDGRIEECGRKIIPYTNCKTTPRTVPNYEFWKRASVR